MNFKSSISLFLISCVLAAQVGFAVFEISCHCLGKHQISLLQIEDPCQKKKQSKKSCCSVSESCNSAQEAPCCPKKVKWVISDDASICSVFEVGSLADLFSLTAVVPTFSEYSIPTFYLEEEQYLRGPPPLLKSRLSQASLQVFLC